MKGRKAKGESRPITGFIFYLCSMTVQDLTAYFETADLPQTLRIDRATTQHDVKEAVARNLETMRTEAKHSGASHRLMRIINALEHPYDGPGIPGRW